MIHPDFEILLDYINRQLDEKALTDLEQHLIVCSECRALITHARELMDSLREQSLATPQASLVRRAVAAFRHVHDRRPERTEAMATLLFDSWDGALPAGVRGHSTERQLLFHFADLDVDVQIIPNGQIVSDGRQQFYRIQGQILRAGISPALLEGIVIKLIQDDSSQFLRQTIVDHLGRFHFSQVPTGHYLLQIELHDTKVRTGALALLTQ